MNISIRPTKESDLPRLSKWIAEDTCPQHRGVDPKWWTNETFGETKPMGTKCFAVELPGGVVYYLKLENVMRCYIQFPPDSERDPEMTKLALKYAFAHISAGARQLGYHEMIFESQSRGLVNLFTTFGFKEAKDNFLVRL